MSAEALLGANPEGIRPGDLGTPPGRHLVALDLDGTTVRHDGWLSPSVRAAVRRAIRAGHHVVIATGRSVLSAMPVVESLGLARGYAVCSNGAVLVGLDPAASEGREVLHAVTFDPAPVLRLLQGTWPGAQVAVEDVGLGFRVSEAFPDQELDGLVRVVSWEEMAATPATRITFRATDGTADDFVRLAERIGLHGVNYTVGFSAWLDVAPEGVSKASALEQVRRRLRVPSARTVAVGDQRNDLEMLRWAGCGVAMGNAPPEVVAAADLVAGHVDDDGLVDILDALPSAGRGRREIGGGRSGSRRR